MDIRIDQQAEFLTLNATLEPSDVTEAGKAVMARTTATFELPKGYHYSAIHPDLLGLASITTFSPWIKQTLRLPFPVSYHFADAIAQTLKIELTNVSPVVERRVPSHDARPGLAFSAGVDSFACLEIMPANTQPVFMHRARPREEAPGLYRADAALRAVREMRDRGVPAIAMRSDLEWVRKPVGFGIDMTPGTTVILLADYFNLDAISYGTVSESAYMTGKTSFFDYTERPIFKNWQRIFGAAGLDSYNCVTPMSEICTSYLARRSEFSHLAQSCVRGKSSEPCRSCVKCFRKSLIESHFSGSWPDSAEIQRMARGRSIRAFLDRDPIHHEIVLAASIANYDGDDPVLNAIQRRTFAREIDWSFTQAWYRPGMDTVAPAKYREGTVSRLEKSIPAMTAEQESTFRNYNVEAKFGSAEDKKQLLRRYQADLNAALA